MQTDFSTSVEMTDASSSGITGESFRNSVAISLQPPVIGRNSFQNSAAIRLKYLLLSFLLLSFFPSSAQEENKKIKFLVKAEPRNSFVQTHHVTMLGVRAGFEFKFPVRCGLGYYWTLTNINSRLYNPADFGFTDPTASPRLRYVTGYIDYSFYKEDDWTLSVPVQIGIGETYYKSSESSRFANGLVVPMEAGVAVDYLFTKWVGFGVGLGYRVMLKGNKAVKENFNSPYYQIRLNILFSEIFRGIKEKKK